jgi:tetratricopeptide (TPR) repeat protein
MISAITLMHRMSIKDFNDSFEMLQLIAERASRQAIPQAWIAKWYVLRLQQGWSNNPDKDSSLAQDATKRALDADPESSLALTIDGLVHTHMLKQHDVAMQRYELAVETNPNNSLAWLLKGTEHAFTGEGVEAVENTQRAIHLSPLDPHRYYYDTLAATAYLANHQYELALELAERSLRANKTHTSSLRAKAVACWQLGDHQRARAAGMALMSLEPNLTISRWLARSPSAEHKIGKEWSEILSKIGVPE